MRSKMPTPLEKWHDYGSPPRCSSFAHVSMKYEKKKNILGVIHNHAIFPGGVGIFDLIFLSHFLSKMGSFCAHQKGNFLRF